LAEVAGRYFVGCFFFASARRSFFFRRFERFLALSLPLLCPISLTFTRLSRERNESECDERHKAVRAAVERRHRYQNADSHAEFFASAKLSQ
jgi:hypothetical protein